MDPFYTYVSIGAAVILLIVLIAFGVMMAELHSTDLFPPTYQKCPDMWVVDDSTGGCIVPPNSGKNKGLLSTQASDPFVFTTSGDGSLPDSSSSSGANGNSKYTDSTHLMNASSTGTRVSLKLNDSTIMSGLYPSISDRCSKKQWALNNGIVWDGVTNYNAC